MIKTYRFSVHKFTDTNNLTFSSIEYSKFKHGSKKYSRKLGMELACEFMKSVEYLTFRNYSVGIKLVVCSAPWKNIPVASTALKDYFINKFVSVWINENYQVVDLKVHRDHSYNIDYGTMTEVQRENAISSDDFYIDNKFIQGKVLFFIDDIFITGAHERRIISLLNTVGFDGKVLFLYYAEYQGKGKPSIENEINYAFMKSLSDMDYIIKNEDLIFNTRLVKFILNSEKCEFIKFILNQDHLFCSLLKQYIESNEYQKIDEFKVNYNQLKLDLLH